MLLAVVIGQLALIFSSDAARRWSGAWLFFGTALLCVHFFVSFHATTAAMAYLILEWSFLLLLWAGCRELGGRTPPRPRAVLYSAPAALAIAAIIATTARSFDDVFIVEAVLMSIGGWACFRELSRIVGAPRSVAIMRAALGLFALLYAAYAPLFWIHEHLLSLPFLSYSSFADLLIAILLGCAMVLVIAEAENRHTHDVVAELEQARSVIEQRLHTDALTEALNRHAFHWMQQGAEIATDGILSGVVVVADIDNLKRINDTFGHRAGDLAIRAVANALRAVIRSDDLLFRWGGDEFVAVIPNLSAPIVHERLAAFEQPIRVRLDDGSPIDCRISCGCAEFGAQSSMDQAIIIADQEMYEARRAR
jgi:diguanylate cyclase (GGDEF)-like protein